MFDLALLAIRIERVGQVLRPTMPLRCLEHHAQGHDLIVNGLVGGRLPICLHRLFRLFVPDNKKPLTH